MVLYYSIFCGLPYGYSENGRLVLGYVSGFVVDFIASEKLLILISGDLGNNPKNP